VVQHRASIAQFISGPESKIRRKSEPPTERGMTARKPAAALLPTQGMYNHIPFSVS
jgi:hypothetical protein